MSEFSSSMSQDTNDVSIPVATSFQFRDATATPQESPLALTDSITTIAVPTNAAEFVIIPAVAIRIGVDSSLANGYAVIPANTPFTYGCARTRSIYVRDNGTNGNLNFWFNLISE